MKSKAIINIGAPPPRWGKITGILTDQGDLKIALDVIHDDLNGKIGDRTALNTPQKTSLVAALNELKGIVDQYSQINDTTTNATQTWSSNKINAAINTAIQTLISGADPDSDTLKELADKITAVAQADSGLISATAAQSFTTPQQAQARANIDAASSTDIGDITAADFVTTVNTAFTNGA